MSPPPAEKSVLPLGTVESRGIGVHVPAPIGNTSSSGSSQKDATNPNPPSTTSNNTNNTIDRSTETQGDGQKRNDDPTPPPPMDPESDSVLQRRVHAEIDAFVRGEAAFSLTAELRAGFTVWTFLTRLPGPTWVDHHPGYLMRGMAYFPLNGCLIGIGLATCFEFFYTAVALPAAVAACLCLAVNFVVTGCFHEDGLGDAADGFGGGWSRQQILTIMTDTRLGTFGCVALGIYIAAKIQILTAIAAVLDNNNDDDDFSNRGWGWGCCWSRTGAAIIAAQTISRLAPTYMIHVFPYVDEGGPKNKFYSFMVSARHLVTPHRVAFALLFSFAVGAYLFDSVTSAILLLSVIAMAHAAGRYALDLIGGVMGDFLGATICVTEVFVLILIYALSAARETMPTTWNGVWVISTQVLTTIGLQHWSNLEEWSRFLKIILHEASQGNSPIGAVVRFGVCFTVTVLWCRNVGHPSVFVRDSAPLVAASANDKKDKDTRDDSLVAAAASSSSASIVVDRSDQQQTFGPSRAVAEAVCQSESSSFQERYDAVRTFLDCLAKPVGSLGTLEDWAARLAALQRTTNVCTEPVACILFAGDHGVAADSSAGGEGCSAYPQAVTRSILKGFERGIAGASILARQNGVAHLRVVDVGVIGDPFDSGSNGVVVSSARKIQGGSRNFCTGSAMTDEETNRCVQVGREEVAQCLCDTGAKVLVFGEVGIGNTTSSSALTSCLANVPLETVCGGGATTTRTASKLDIDKKISIVKRALERHETIISPMDALAKLGGSEIAALVGAILEASERDVPLLVDGFVVTVAALVAVSISPVVGRILFFATKSTEPGQRVALEAIRVQTSRTGSVESISMPAIDMSLRLGEGTGALIALPLLRSASCVMQEMGTIADILK